MPPPCQPPDCWPAAGPGHENGIERWWKRISEYSISPKAATTFDRPALTWNSRESSGWALPHPVTAHSAHARSAPGHSVEPSPPVKVSAQEFQFIEPELSTARSRRALVSRVDEPESNSSSSNSEWQPSSAGKSIRPSLSLSTPSWQAR
jgi:hypothetical protein